MVKLYHFIYTVIIGLLSVQVALYTYADNADNATAGLKRAQLNAPSQSRPNPNSSSPIALNPTPTQSPLALATERTKVLENATQWQRDMAALSQALPGRLNKEPRDPDWARPLEQRIRDSFVQDEQLRAFDLARVQCRSQLCAISIAVDSDASIEFMSQITAVVRQQDWYQAFQHMVFHGDRNADNQITLFLE